MSDTTRSEYFDDFEIITDVNETAFPEQNESKNMETNNEAEMPGQGKPTPVPRSRGTKDDMQALQRQHDKRESRWAKEKEELKEENYKLQEENKKLLNEKKEKDEVQEEKKKLLDENGELQEKIDNLEKQKIEHEENAIAFRNDYEAWKKKFEELEERNTELFSEKQQACETIKQLQDKSGEMDQQNQEYFENSQKFQNEAFILRQHLDEKTELLERASERIKVYQNQQNENDQQIQRLREELENHKKMLAKQKQQYAEFSSITNDMERELHESQAKGRELNKILQSKTKEHKQMLQEKDEMIGKFEKKNESLASQLEMMKNNAGQTQSDRDKLESELVALKLENKQVIADSEKMHALNQKLAEQCNGLEEMRKQNADDETSELTKAVDALNKENNILRQRNEKLQRDVSGLCSIKNALEAEVEQLKQTVGQDNGGFSREDSYRQKKPEAMDTTNDINTSSIGRTSRSSDRSTPIPRERTLPTTAGTPNGGSTSAPTAAASNTPVEPWYETEEGGQIFSEIYSELNGKFATIDISREVSTKDISLFMTTDQRQKLTVHFPVNFPLAAVKVNFAGALREITVPFNKNSISKFCEDFSRMLTELVYDADGRQK